MTGRPFQRGSGRRIISAGWQAPLCLPKRPRRRPGRCRLCPAPPRGLGPARRGRWRFAAPCTSSSRARAPPPWRSRWAGRRAGSARCRRVAEGWAAWRDERSAPWGGGLPVYGAPARAARIGVAHDLQGRRACAARTPVGPQARRLTSKNSCWRLLDKRKQLCFQEHSAAPAARRECVCAAAVALSPARP